MDKEKDLEKKLKEKNQEMLMVREAATEKYNIDEELRRMRYLEYLKISETERVEWLDGQIYYMAAPVLKHQDLVLDLGVIFRIHLHGKTCKPFIAPCEVKIDFLNGSDSELQPDVMVVCDPEKLDERGIKGPPDLIIEVLSPSTARYDRVNKFNKYLAVGVREYWIIDPLKEEILVNLLTDDKLNYLTQTYKKGDNVKVSVLDDLVINVTNLFEGYLVIEDFKN